MRIALADPAGSALAHYVNHGELKAEGNSISEGIGSSRITANFDRATIDHAWSIPDEESLPLLHALLHDEGLNVGGSSGVNLAGAIHLARELGSGPHDRDRARRCRHALPSERSSTRRSCARRACPCRSGWIARFRRP